MRALLAVCASSTATAADRLPAFGLHAKVLAVLYAAALLHCLSVDFARVNNTLSRSQVVEQLLPALSCLLVAF